MNKDKKILVGTLGYLNKLIEEYGPEAPIIQVIELELQK